MKWRVKSRGVGLITVVIMLGVTYWFSSKDGGESTRQAVMVMESLNIIGIAGVEADTVKYFKMVNILKSLAHFSLYIFVGAGAYLFSQSAKKSLAISISIACIDELHQYYVPGRKMDIRDVIIDTLGALSGVLIIKCAESIKNKSGTGRMKKFKKIKISQN